MLEKRPITVAYGDGIGPEIMKAVLFVLKEAGAKLEIEEIVIGEKIYRSGIKSGIDAEALESLRKNKVFLKAPISTPQGGGFKSLNVTIREILGLYANVRPCFSYYPYIKTKHPGMDLVIVRENEEDLYAGLEYRHSDDVFETLKLITRAGCERIISYAFEYARQNGRKKVTCMTKDNIMKLTDGLFHKIFEEIAIQYPDLIHEHWIVDIGAAKLADNPLNFDLVVLPNLYGDILSDIAAQLAGSIGLAASANIGQSCAMFEAVHGSAPKHAGKDLANPSGLLLAAVQMLIYLGQKEIAELVQGAWLKTIEDGIHTKDVFSEGSSRQVGTEEFSKEVAKRLGQKPEQLKVTSSNNAIAIAKFNSFVPKITTPQKINGVDIFIEHQGGADSLAEQVKLLGEPKLSLEFISNRGITVWPKGLPETFCVNHWRCRYRANQEDLNYQDILNLLKLISDRGFIPIQTETLLVGSKDGH